MPYYGGIFENKVTVITGASSGIGEAMARMLSGKGAKVVLAARRADKLKELSGELKGSIYIETDVTDERSVKELFDKTVSKHGSIDILINNAGILLNKPIMETSPEEIRAVMETDYFGAVWCAVAALKVMKIQKSGTIVNISSIAGRIGLPNLAYYGASKFALTCFSEALRQEVASDGITVINVCPGMVETEMTGTIIKEARARGKNIMPIPAEKVAKRILRAIKNKETEVFVPFSTRILYIMHFICPSFVEWLAWKFRAVDKSTFKNK